MKPVKFLALVISAIMVTLSIPHISLISIGSGVAEAATQKVYAVPSSLSIIGKLCPGLSGKYRCASKSGRFEVVTCAPHNVWVEPDQNLLIVRDSYGACRTYCEGTYSSSCIEPYSTVTRDPETNMNPGQQIMTFTSTTSYPFTSSSSPGYQDVRSHTIQFKEVGSVNRAWTTWNCGTEKTCPAQNTFTGAIAGNTIQYWSDIVFEDGTRVRNPQTGEYSFLLSSAGGTSGGLTGPSSMTIAVGAATTSQISGGTGAHTATSSATNIATATISGTTLTARGVLAGTATITVRDSSPSQKTATIQVTVTSGGTPRLTVTKSGSGTVTSNPNGINCGSTCWYDFSQGSLVTLTANPSTGQFTGACSGTGTCQLTMSAAKTVTATFSGTGTPQLCNGQPQPQGPCQSGAWQCVNNAWACATASGGIIVSVSPESPAVNTPVTMRFTVPQDPTATGLRLALRYPSGSATQPGIPWNVFGCPPDCTYTFTPTQTGTYTYDVRVARGAASGNPTTSSFQVASSSSSPPSGTGHCCVIRMEPFEYKSDILEDACVQLNGRWFGSISCASAQDPACDEYCRVVKNTGNGGDCNVRAPGAQQFDICYNRGDTCKCSVAGQLNNANLPCNQACSTDSRVSAYSSPYAAGQSAQIPLGQCTGDVQSFILAWTATTGTTTSAGQYAQRPFALSQIPGQYQCDPDQYCMCTFLNLNSFTASNPSPVSSTPGSIRWDAPDAITNIPPKQPNQRDCSVAANATITASFGGNQTSGAGAASSARLIQAGDSVTITGHVGKFSDQCEGYNYTCRTEQVLQCESHNRVLWNSFGYKDCPAGTTQVHAEGEGRKANVELIVGIAMVAASFFTGGATLAAFLSQVGWSTVIDGVVRSTQCGSGPDQGNALLYYQLLQQAQNSQNTNNPSGTCNGQQQPHGPCQSGSWQCVNNAWACAGEGGAGNTGNTNTGGNCETCKVSRVWCSSGTGGHCEDNSDKCVGNEIPIGPGNTCPSSSSSTSGTGAGGNQAQTPPGSTSSDVTVPQGLYASGISCNDRSGCPSLLNTCSGDSYLEKMSTPGCINSQCYYLYQEYQSCGVFKCQNNACVTTTAAATAKPTLEITGNIPTDAAGKSLSGAAGSGAGTAASFNFNPYALGASYALSRIPICPTEEDLRDCFSVCGRTYKTNASAAPVCNGPVIGFEDANYRCPSGLCGGFENKQVKILIKGPDGATAIDDTTTTDSNGDYSYTFVAPGADGEFTAIVSVPRD